MLQKLNSVVFKAAKYTIILICWCWMIGFLGGLVCQLLSAIDKPMASSIIRLPIGSPGGIAVDSKGQIYCISGFYSRIQIYNNSGLFLKGWFVQPASRISQIIIDNKDNIHIEADCYKEDSLIQDKNKIAYNIYDTDGNLLEKCSDEFSSFSKNNPFEATDNSGNIYRIKDYWFFPKIVKILPSGKEYIIISDPVYLWFIKGPLPSVVGILGVSIIYSFFGLKRKLCSGSAIFGVKIGKMELKI